jgi:hypothetical protein
MRPCVCMICAMLKRPEQALPVRKSLDQLVRQVEGEGGFANPSHSRDQLNGGRVQVSLVPRSQSTDAADIAAEPSSARPGGNDDWHVDEESAATVVEVVGVVLVAEEHDVAWLVVELYRPGVLLEPASHPVLSLNTARIDSALAARAIDQADLEVWYEVINPVRVTTVDGKPPAADYSSMTCGF